MIFFLKNCDPHLHLGPLSHTYSKVWSKQHGRQQLVCCTHFLNPFTVFEETLDKINIFSTVYMCQIPVNLL